MKKIKILAVILCFAVLLSGCEVHFADGTRYEVSWWVAALFSVPFWILGAILTYVNSPKEFWAYCPKCEEIFYVKKRVIRFSYHSPEDGFGFIYRCPCCKKKHICYKSWDN